METQAGSLSAVIASFNGMIVQLAGGLATLVVSVRGLQWMFGRRDEARTGLYAAFWGLGIILAAAWLVNLARTITTSVVR